jgi:hypothetical protein
MPANHRSTDVQLLVALEAVLGTQQLSEIREMVRGRVADAVPMDDEGVWSVVLAVDELTSAVLHQFDRCPGLRVYRDGPSVRVEVDVPRPPSQHPGGDSRSPEPGAPAVQPPVLARQVIEALVSNWGVEHGNVDRRWGVDPRPGGSTVWCLIDYDTAGGGGST